LTIVKECLAFDALAPSASNGKARLARCSGGALRVVHGADRDTNASLSWCRCRSPERSCRRRSPPQRRRSSAPSPGINVLQRSLTIAAEGRASSSLALVRTVTGS
jgi:hypothetical protein